MATIGSASTISPTAAGTFNMSIIRRPRDTVSRTARRSSAAAAALMFYAPGLLGYSAVKIASPTFYAMRDSRTPVIVSVLSVLVNLGLNLALVRVMGFRGLAFGTAIAAVFNALALLWLLRGRLGGLDGRRLFDTLIKVSVASAAMGVAAYVTVSWLTTVVPGDAEGARIIRVIGSIATALIVLTGSARLMRIREFDDAVARVVGRLRRR